jgi:molecular chaperone DnaK
MDHVNPDEVVAIGAAIQAAALTDAARRRAVPPAPIPAGVPSGRRVQTVPGVMRERMPTIPEGDASFDMSNRTFAKAAISAPSSPRVSSPFLAPASPSTPASSARDATRVSPLPTSAPHAKTESHAEIPSLEALVAAASSTSLPTATATSVGVPTHAEVDESSSPPETFKSPPALSIPAPFARAPSHPPTDSAPVLIDVTPRALVVETVAGFCDVVIPRNARIPCDCTRIFATVSDMQSVVRIRVAQGEDEHFAKNTFLGELELSGIRAAPRGEVSISVNFELDANGSLRVQAADTATGRETRAVLQLMGIAEEDAIAAMSRRHAGMQLAPTFANGAATNGSVRPGNG